MLSPSADRVEGPLMGPNPAGIVLEGVLAFPGIILNLNDSLLDTDSGYKFEWQAHKNIGKKKNKNLLFFISLILKHVYGYCLVYS